jgi:hypothetical protein
MTVRTHTFARFEDESMTVGYTYDDTTGEVLSVIVTNNHPTKTLEAGVIGLGRGKAGRSREGSWGPNFGTAEISIPAPQRPQMDLVPDGGDPGRDDYYPTLDTLECWARTV